jgi:hypothetical protein
MPPDPAEAVAYIQGVLEQVVKNQDRMHAENLAEHAQNRKDHAEFFRRFEKFDEKRILLSADDFRGLCIHFIRWSTVAFATWLLYLYAMHGGTIFDLG